MNATGEFSTKFAATRTWKVDEGLQRALRLAINSIEVDRSPMVVADIGAGGGAYVRWASAIAGVLALGVDGTSRIEATSGGFVREVNLATYPVSDKWLLRVWLDRMASVKRSTVDLAWFIEVGEHIPAEYEAHVIDLVAAARARMLVVSWAVPGQRGRGHVNCHTPEWVALQFSKRGYLFKETWTCELRAEAGKGWDRKLLAFHHQG